jgi:hypothetical protein
VQHDSEATGYFKLAADQNNALSQNHCAICLATGGGVVRNEVEAAEHYELAVDYNHTSAQFHYAVCFAQGRSVPKNQLKLLDITNWLPIKMMYRHNDIPWNCSRLFETKLSPIGCPTGVGLPTTTPRLTRLREMPQQRIKPNQQQTCRNNEQNQMNNRHAGTPNKIQSTRDMPA